MSSPAGGWSSASAAIASQGAILGVPALAGVWTGYNSPGEGGPTSAAFFHLSGVLFQLFVLTVLLSTVHREKSISVDTIAAALCGYLLIGIAFGHVYSLCEDLVPHSFNGLDTAASGYRTHFLLTYFSFTTLTTLGYGDITSEKDTARSLAMVEAVAGQVYLAVLVAELVGKRVAQAISPESPPHE